MRSRSRRTSMSTRSSCGRPRRAAERPRRSASEKPVSVLAPRAPSAIGCVRRAKRQRGAVSGSRRCHNYLEVEAVASMLSDFKKFLVKGNLVTLAVAFVMATVFALLVKAFIADLITPIIALIFGKPDFGALSFTINSSHFLYGDFINNLITFVSVAAAVFFFVIKPLNHLQSARAQEDPDTKECPECTSVIPVKARRCPQCTAQIATGEGGAIDRTTPSTA